MTTTPTMNRAPDCQLQDQPRALVAVPARIWGPARWALGSLQDAIKSEAERRLPERSDHADLLDRLTDYPRPD